LKDALENDLPDALLTSRLSKINSPLKDFSSFLRRKESSQKNYLSVNYLCIIMFLKVIHFSLFHLSFALAFLFSIFNISF